MDSRRNIIELLKDTENKAFEIKDRKGARVVNYKKEGDIVAAFEFYCENLSNGEYSITTRPHKDAYNSNDTQTFDFTIGDSVPIQAQRGRDFQHNKTPVMSAETLTELKETLKKEARAELQQEKFLAEWNVFYGQWQEFWKREEEAYNAPSPKKKANVTENLAKIATKAPELINGFNSLKGLVP